jgi:hypothetical protein
VADRTVGTTKALDKWLASSRALWSAAIPLPLFSVVLALSWQAITRSPNVAMALQRAARACDATLHFLAWAIQITCSIMKSGTKNVGMRLNGSTVIGNIEGPCGSNKRAVVPRLTAVTRSSIPSICQAIKLPRCAGSASFQAANPAVAPINISPYPAGHANSAGSRLRASSTMNVNPAILPTCTAVKTFGFSDKANVRNPSDAANHTQNTIRGTAAATATPTPNCANGFKNKCASEAQKTATNHTASNPAVIFPYLVIANLLVS